MESAKASEEEGCAREMKEMSIFLDVFRRADKNDDGALSWQEFQSFFADGVLSQSDLKKLFAEIDTHNTNNIDTGELCSYFSQHLGAFRDIFRAVENLNLSVSKALMSSAQEYPTASFTEQFVNRFLLREIISQLSAVVKPLDAASDSLEEKALQDSLEPQELSNVSASDELPVSHEVMESEGVSQSESSGDAGSRRITPGRVGRRARRQYSSQLSGGSEIGMTASSLTSQVDRLRQLVDRMENKVNLNGVTDEVLDIKKQDLAVIVHRKMHVEEENKKAFQKSLRYYVEEANANEKSLHVSVQTFSGCNAVVIYEIWKDQDAWKSQLSSEASKAFQRSNIDCLTFPEQVNSMQVPASWWLQADY